MLNKKGGAPVQLTVPGQYVMLLWKARAGYVVNPQGTFVINSLSEIVFTDDAYYSVATTMNSPMDQTFGNGPLLGEYLATNFPDDYFTMYGLPYGNKSDYDRYRTNNVTYAIPSLILPFENLVEHNNSNESRYTDYPALYVPALKRLFVVNGSYSGFTYIVKDDGTLVKLAGVSSTIPTCNAYISWYSLTSHSVIYDGTVESLMNPNNWYYFAVSSGNWRATIAKDSFSAANLQSFWSDYSPPDFDTDTDSNNPYEPGGDSTEGTLPPGTFDDTSDPIPIDPIPTLSAADTGFTRIYNPTLAQVKQLANYLWTEPSIIDTIWNHIKQFFEDPMQAIIGFNLVPCKVPDGGAENLRILFIDTGVSMNTAASQFVDVDCGIFKLERYYGSAIDQSPYTKVTCYLPYIGTVNLNTDEVMGAELHVIYRIDIVTGSCVAYILVDGNVLYQYSGHCAITIPISSADFSNYVTAAISVAKLAVGAAVAGAEGAIASTLTDPVQTTNRTTTTTTENVTTQRNPSTGRQVTAGTVRSTETVQTTEEVTGTGASFVGLSPASVSNTVAQIMGSKSAVEHSGSFSGNSGYLGKRRPFLIIERPNMCMPSEYNRFNGYPSMITMLLGECSGFTRVQQVQLTGMSATNPEQSEILQLLKSGVIL